LHLEGIGDQGNSALGQLRIVVCVLLLLFRENLTHDFVEFSFLIAPQTQGAFYFGDEVEEQFVDPLDVVLGVDVETLFDDLCKFDKLLPEV
jgi:hypothetical protein